MKKLLFVSAAVFVLIASQAQAQTRHYYDSMGRSAGSAVKSGGSTLYYDSMGRYKGSSSK